MNIGWLSLSLRLMTRFPTMAYKVGTSLPQKFISLFYLLFHSTHSVCHLLVLVSEISYLKYLQGHFLTPFGSLIQLYHLSENSSDHLSSPLPVFLFCFIFCLINCFMLLGWIVYSFPDSYIEALALQFLRIFDNIGGIIGALKQQLSQTMLSGWSLIQWCPSKKRRRVTGNVWTQGRAMWGGHSEKGAVCQGERVRRNQASKTLILNF